MYKEEVRLNDARRVDQGVGGAAFGGVGRVFRPAPRLTDESMIDLNCHETGRRDAFEL